MDLAARREKLQEEKRLARLSSDHPAEERRGEAAAASARTVRQLVTERERRRQRRQRHRPPTAAPHTTQQRSSLVSHLFLATYPTSSRRPRWPFPASLPFTSARPLHTPPRLSHHHVFFATSLRRPRAFAVVTTRTWPPASHAPWMTSPFVSEHYHLLLLLASPERQRRPRLSSLPPRSLPFHPRPSQRDTAGTSVRPPP